MSAKTFSCPHCGLLLTLKPGKGGTRLTYNLQEWKRLCTHLDLESPVLCLLERRGFRFQVSGGWRNSRMPTP
jgi:hypothetical protein